MRTDDVTARSKSSRAFLELLWVFLKLGVTSFGGPIAHLAYFRAEFVERRKWLDDAACADIIALCQFLPGPASSQAGMILGMIRAGVPGGFAAWFGFTVPSALALAAFAYGLGNLGDIKHAAWLHGLKIAAAAVVAQAVWRMGQNFCCGPEKATLAVAAMLLTLAIPSAAGQIGAIAAGGVIGWRLLSAANNAAAARLAIPLGRKSAVTSLALFTTLLIGLPLLATATSSHTIALISSFYRSGALVFGGGHVVLPLLQQAVVPRGWISNDAFLAGYGAAQAVPGPLFTFAAYLGTAMNLPPNGFAGGLICLAAIYYHPSFL
jgi:chromate transporter